MSTLDEIQEPAETAWLLLAEQLIELGPTPCQESDAEAWFTTRLDEAAMPIRACAGCPVRSACLAYAVAADVRDGIWGGRSFDRHLSKRLKAAS